MLIITVVIINTKVSGTTVIINDIIIMIISLIEAHLYGIILIQIQRLLNSTFFIKYNLLTQVS